MGCTVEDLERKMKIMYEAEQKLIRETKELHIKDAELAAEIDKIHNKLDQLTTFVKDNTLLVDKNKHYSDEYIYEVRMKTSINKAAKALGVSVSTVNRACARHRDKILNDFDV